MAYSLTRHANHVSQLFANPAELDRLIEWRMGSIKYMSNYDYVNKLKEEHPMQRQFTLELRVDYADSGKNDAMRKALAAAARHVYATASLLADGVKPQVSIYSDDFFTGHEEIKLLEDTIAQGTSELDGCSEGDERAAARNESEQGLSPDLMAAVRQG